MPVYGSFETVREVSRSGLGAVYTARRVGSTDERFAIKVFRPPAALGMEDDEIERDSACFLGAAEVQKSVGRPGSAWAPVYEVGRVEGGAWYATDLFDRSIDRFLLNRPDLEPSDVLRVVDSVVSGLFELRDSAGRAHGNLKTSNVLLSVGKGDLAAARVALCDPWPKEQLRGSEARDDLRALGDLIHWLVLHRGVRRPTGWPVQVSPEWKRLGRVGDGWLSLTNKLLDPTDDKLVLDQVPGLIPGGKVRPGSSTTALPTPVARAGRDGKSDVTSEPPKSQPAKSEPSKPEPPRVEPPKVEAAKEVVPVEPPKAEPIQSRVSTPAAEAVPVAPAPVATPPSKPGEPAVVDPDVTQDLPALGSGAGSGAGSGVVVDGGGSRDASGAAARAGGPTAATLSRAPSLAGVGRVSTASVADAPKSFEELAAADTAPKRDKPSNAKWIGIGVGAVALVAVAAVVISNLGGNKDKQGDNKNGPGPFAVNEPPKKNETKETPKVDPPKGGEQTKPEDADAKKQAEEARKREEDRIKKEAAEKAAADKAAADKAAKDEADRKAKEAADKAASDKAAADKAAADKAAADKAAKDEADRKAKEASDKAAADKAAADKAAKDEADRKAKEASDKAAADKAAADSAKATKVAGAKALVQKLAGHLSLGLGFKDVAPEGGGSIEALLKQLDVSVEKDAVAGDAALADALARARGLANIEAITDAPAAARAAADESGRGHASEALAAASRALGLFKEPAVGDMDALEAGGKFLEGVRDSVGKLPNSVAARRDAIVKTANDRRRAMFVAGVKGVAENDEKAIRQAAEMAPRFGATLDDLPAKARLNLLVLGLKSELGAASEKKDDAAGTAALAKFKNAAQVLAGAAPEVAPAVAAMSAGLDAASKTPEAPAGPMLDFAKVGPMSAGGGWTLDAASPAAGDFSSVTYKSPSGQSVQFIRLTGTNTYLAATETTLGVFADVVKTQPALLRQALLVERSELQGPFTWEKNGNNIVVSKGSTRPGEDPFGWLPSHSALTNTKISPYPTGLEAAIGEPTLRHPMQQVTAQVSGEAAKAIGCRLPTEAEWNAALSMAGEDPTPNVRDASWIKYQDYLNLVSTTKVGAAAPPPRENLPWPEKNTFALGTRVQFAKQSKAEPSTTDSDGVLWFRPVPEADGKFHDLVGNVAEWLQTSGSGARAAVIGGSALSPKEIDPKVAQTGSFPRAYADVGFRLAFDAAGGTAPAPEPLFARLKKAADAIVLAK